MITKIFLIQLFLTFLTGSCWIYLTVFAGLRFGSKTGGFIGGLPSTALLSFFFIGFTQSPAVASNITTIFPLAISVSGLFLVVYAIIANKGFLPALVSALFFWFIMAAILVFFKWENFVLNLFIYFLVMISALFAIEKGLVIKSVPAPKTAQSSKHLVFRAVFGGFIVMLTVFISKTAGPVLGGIFAAFPAMFISTLTIAYKTQGIDFSRAMTKPLLLTGMITVAVFAVAVRYLYLYTGLYMGTGLAICISAVSAFLTFHYILPKIK